MAHAAYDGIFLAPESIVTVPGFTPSDLDGLLQRDPAGGRAQRTADTEQRPGRNASEQ
jgi:hypothetical protein